MTATEAGPVDPVDAFNDANDYLDIRPGDDEARGAYMPFVSPDNVDTSKRSLMVEEDTGNAGQLLLRTIPAS